MGKKLLHLTVMTKDGRYNFFVLADPKHLEHWKSIGVDIDPICNVISEWIPAWLTKQWAFAQDVFNFKNPWSKT